MSYEYVDRSIEVTQQVDADRLAQVSLGDAIGEPGSLAVFHALEGMETAGVAIGI
ncbi:MAG TPA: hypothetical protein VK712_04105 [Verrucomicrobiae bacterium]|jgi:hypothetical protein|nr:hypothetical protein [Verrucomicrobiae bacterium]